MKSFLMIATSLILMMYFNLGCGDQQNIDSTPLQSTCQDGSGMCDDDDIVSDDDLVYYDKTVVIDGTNYNIAYKIAKNSIIEGESFQLSVTFEPKLPTDVEIEIHVIHDSTDNSDYVTTYKKDELPIGTMTTTYYIKTEDDTEIEALEKSTIRLKVNGEDTSYYQKVTIEDNDVNNDVNNDVTVVPSTGTVSGIIYQDTDGNGAKASGELGIADVSVTITDSDNNTFTQLSGASGTYTFYNVLAGSVNINIDVTTLPGGAAAWNTAPTEGSNPTDIVLIEGALIMDTDGFEPAAPAPIIDNDGDGQSPPDDCDDTDPDIYFGACELVPNDGIDNDCSGIIDDEIPCGGFI